MSKALMSIGMFSRASLLSIKALRSYHEAGILVPARIDPATGNRSYLPTQLPDAAIMRRLRALDLPLSDIGEILRARDPEITRKVLAEHGSLLQERLERIEYAVAEIQASLAHPISQTPVHVREAPSALTIEYRGYVAEADFAPFLDAAYLALYGMLGRLGLAPSGPPGALYPAVIEDVQEVVAYVPIAAPTQAYPGHSAGEVSAYPLLPDDRGAVALGEVPAATVAVLTHHGSYATIADTYHLLGRWVAENATTADLQVHEVYVIGPTEADQPDRYRTDICWPLSAGSTHTTGGLS